MKEKVYGLYDGVKLVSRTIGQPEAHSLFCDFMDYESIFAQQSQPQDGSANFTKAFDGLS